MVLTFVETTPLDSGSPTRGWRTTALKLAASDRVLSLRELLTLLAIGCVERNPGPSDDELKPFYASTQPLKFWLDQANFRFTIAAYQRGYEWKETQISRLQKDLEQLLCKEYKVIKLAEVFLYQEPGTADQGTRLRKVVAPDFLDRLNSPEWYKDCQREVEVVDGQQRITTFVLIYAVIQYWLFRIQKDLSSEEGGLAETIATKTQGMIDRFTFKSRVNSCILLRRHIAGGRYLEPLMFKQVSKLGEYFEKGNKTADKSDIEGCNAWQLYSWIHEKVKDKCSRKKLDWLTHLLDVLDNKVYWTATLTTDATLALTTFVSSNSPATMVPLNQIDVIKVAIVSSIKERSVSVAKAPELSRSDALTICLNSWKDATRLLKGVMIQYGGKNNPKEIPFADLTTRDTSSGCSDNNTATSLMVDLLTFVKTILTCDTSSEGSKLSKNFSLEEFYCHLRAAHLEKQDDKWSAVDFMANIYKYAFALTILLKREGLSISLRLTISNLLGFPNQDWRPFAMLVVACLNSNKNVTEGDPPNLINLHFATKKKWTELAEKALEAIELLVCCFAAMESDKDMKNDAKPIQKQVYNALINWVLKTDNGQTVCDKLRSEVELQWKNYSGITSGMNHYIIEKLYLAEDLYSTKIGRSLLLMLEHKYILDKNNAKESIWAKDLSVEHILPQNPENVELSDIDFPKGSRKHVLSMLGNLALLTRPDNSKLSNRYWRSNSIAGKVGKRELLQKEGYDDSIELTKRLTKDYEHWRLEEFLQRHNELFKHLAEKFGFEEWDKYVLEWEKQLEEQCKEDESGSQPNVLPAGSSQSVDREDLNLKWSDDPASLKDKLGDKLGDFLLSLVGKIKEIDESGTAKWENKHLENVREHMFGIYPDLNLDLNNGEIVKARRSYDLMNNLGLSENNQIKRTYRQLLLRTQVFLDAMLDATIRKYVITGNTALSPTQRRKFQQTMLDFCEELGYNADYAILDKFGVNIIKTREKKLANDGSSYGEKRFKEELAKARKSNNNEVLLKHFEQLAKQLGLSNQDAKDHVSQEPPTSQPFEEPTSHSPEDPTSQPSEEPISQPPEEPTSQPPEEPTSQPPEDAAFPHVDEAVSMKFLEKRGLKREFSTFLKLLDQRKELIDGVMGKMTFIKPEPGHTPKDSERTVAIKLINELIKEGIDVISYKKYLLKQLQKSKLSVKRLASKNIFYYKGKDYHNVAQVPYFVFPPSGWDRGRPGKPMPITPEQHNHPAFQIFLEEKSQFEEFRVYANSKEMREDMKMVFLEERGLYKEFSNFEEIEPFLLGHSWLEYGKLVDAATKLFSISFSKRKINFLRSRTSGLIGEKIVAAHLVNKAIKDGIDVFTREQDFLQQLARSIEGATFIEQSGAFIKDNAGFYDLNNDSWKTDLDTVIQDFPRETWPRSKPVVNTPSTSPAFQSFLKEKNLTRDFNEFAEKEPLQ